MTNGTNPMLHSSRVAACVVAALLVALPTATVAAAQGTGDDAEPDVALDQGALTWGVAPSGSEGDRAAFDYELDPGETVTDSVTVSNHSADELILDVYAHDAFTTENGGFDLLAADDEATDVGSWVTVTEPTVTIPARSRTDVELELVVPENATPGDHAGGVVASLASAMQDDGGDQVLVEHRVGTRIYLRVSGDLEPAFAIEQLDAEYAGTLNPFGAGSVTATYTIRNTGNVRLTGLPNAEVAGPFGIGRRSADGEALPEILPGDSYETTVEVDGAIPLFRLGTEIGVEPAGVDGEQFEVPYETAGRDVGVSAVPWTSIALLLLVAGAIVAVIRLRRRNAKQLATKLSAARAEGAAQARAGDGEQDAANGAEQAHVDDDDTGSNGQRAVPTHAAQGENT